MNALKLELETSNSEVSKLNSEKSEFAFQLEEKISESASLLEDKLVLMESKNQMESDLAELKDREQSASEKIEKLRLEVGEAEKLRIELNEANNHLKTVKDEAIHLRSQIKQFESMSDVSGVKEENLLLSEKCSQYEEEKHLTERRCEDKWRE